MSYKDGRGKEKSGEEAVFRMRGLLLYTPFKLNLFRLNIPNFEQEKDVLLIARL